MSCLSHLFKFSYDFCIDFRRYHCESDRRVDSVSSLSCTVELGLTVILSKISSASNASIVNVIDGTVTNEQVQFLIFKTQPQTLGSALGALLNAVINVIAPADNNVKVNCFARLPSAPT